MIEIITPPEFDAGFWLLALDHLKVDDEDLHLLVEQYVDAAIGQVEACSGRRLFKQSLRLTVDGFGRAIELPASPVIAVTKVEYLDAQGGLQTLPSGDYALIDRLGTPKLIPAHGHSWPATATFPGAVLIEFDAGYAGADNDLDLIPAPLRQAVLMTCADWFRFGGNVATVALHGIPDDAYRACQPFRREWQ